jgi:hypothetical protein
LPDDNQNGLKFDARFLTIKLYVLMVQTKKNKPALKREVNVRV